MLINKTFSHSHKEYISIDIYKKEYFQILCLHFNECATQILDNNITLFLI